MNNVDAREESQVKCAILKEQADLQTMAVEQEARAWKLKWMIAAKHETQYKSSVMNNLPLDPFHPPPEK